MVAARTARRRPALLVAVAGALVVGVVLVRTARLGSAEPVPPRAPEVAVPDGAAHRLAGALRFPTISSDDPDAFKGEAFGALHTYLSAVFPRVHSTLRRDLIGTHSLLYTWQGSDPSLRPILLLGHLDVVPVEAASVSTWQHDPFGGQVADGFIWGRGAIDHKSAVVGMLEAVEMLLGADFRPARTVYLAYGHDEEVGGMHGARAIAAQLTARGVELEMVLDEGGVIGDGLLPGIAAPVALIGVAEKGFVTLELTTRTAGGHSSLPPRQSAVGILSAAVARLEEHQMPARLDGPTRQMFERVGPQFPLVQRAVFANLWLTRALVLRSLAANPATNAMVRTTTAATIFQAGTKDNVLPSHARAAINFRILPGDSVAGVVARVGRVIADARVEVNAAGRFTAEPSAVSPADGGAFQTLARTIRSIDPDVIVAPYLVVVVTDARYYTGLSRNVFRFLPVRLSSRDLARMHGVDERIGIAEYETAIRIYRQLVLDAAGR
jgi:carboxypeptidase PM20D1